MKPALILILLGFIHQLPAQINAKASRFVRKDTVKTAVIQQANASSVKTGAFLQKADTTPKMRKYDHIERPTSKYAKMVSEVYRPPVKLTPTGPQPIPEADAATVEDSTELAKQIERLLAIIRSNYTVAIDNFVDTTKEISKIKELNWANKKVYKRDIKGVTYNIHLLENIFKKKDFDSEDVEMISYIFHNNDSLIYNMQFKNYDLVFKLSAKPFEVTLVDTLQQKIPAATCYFVSKAVWRDLVNSKECPADPLKIICPDNILPEVENQADKAKFIYNVTNPDSQIFRVMYGSYHLLILVNNKIGYHETFTVDKNTSATTLRLLYGL